jgi:hypothetical protein
VGLDDPRLLARERSGLAQYRLRHADLAKVVQECPRLQVLQRVFVQAEFHAHRPRNGGDRERVIGTIAFCVGGVLQEGRCERLGPLPAIGAGPRAVV